MPESCKVWAFAHISEGAEICEGSTFGEGCHVGKLVKIGFNCKIGNHAQLFEGVELGNNVFVAPGVVTTNDYRPDLFCSDWRKKTFKKTIIEDDVVIGANATIICGIRIGKGAFIGAGSVVTKDVPAGKTVKGNPAK